MQAYRGIHCDIGIVHAYMRAIVEHYDDNNWHDHDVPQYFFTVIHCNKLFIHVHMAQNDTARHEQLS